MDEDTTLPRPHATGASSAGHSTTAPAGAPQELLDIVARAMAREPTRRDPSARELAEDLRRMAAPGRAAMTTYACR